jgi:glycosyltransferase involved in cell wall biosynthesis
MTIHLNYLISIITPVHNSEKFISETIKSIQEQTYSNWELFLIDDCSTDNTYRILKRISSKDKRIKLYRNNKNMKIGKVEEALVAGKMLRRAGWPEEHFIFRQVPSMINSKIVPKMQSLPDDVKAFFDKTFDPKNNYQIDNIYYSDQVCYVGFSNNLINFAFQAADVFAEDWKEFKI